ncbi:unnamed protein product [Pleuronectes platessa]|uniref:Phorbol-ester/DAG-type domain-containing protein n=1 Tax=Pleuronectes platessa TaxID=8262 RepID=A0A9N7TWW2_PLEPL|nr:unnamed protein product [Pleuronectes platessa]
MTTERGQIEMSASNLNQRSPVLDPLTRIAQMTTERGQIEMSASNLNQRSPVLDPLTRIAQMTTERGQIEMSASNLNQRSPVLDPLTRIAQMTTERGQIEMSASNLNQRSPVLDPLTRIAQCPKHHLVCATIGSLDKCVQCVGPVSSKWLGYQCKVCSGVWHKSCLRRINDNLQHHSKGQQFSECPEGELSSDQENMSDMEYVPDSESQEDEEDEDNEDSDARVPFIDFYRLPVPTTQLAKISKLLLTMEKGHLSSLQGKSLDEIELEEELALTDTEAKDSEGESDESDTAVTASEGGNAEPVGAALASTLTEQVQETADLAGTVSSTVDETASPSEGKTHQEHHSRKVKKKIWSKAEEAAVMRHFKAYILKGRLATKHECSHCKMVEGSVLAQRTVQNIRDFVRNRGTTAKRKAEQQKL